MSNYQPMTDEELDAIFPLPKARETEPMVTITRKEWEYLLERDRLLTKLEQGGVDNWQGYSYAMNMEDDDEKE